MVEESYTPEKWIWTDADFDRMNWHDNHILAVACLQKTQEFLLDIDYICQWICPSPIAENRSIWFWIAPATLIFEGVSKVEGEINIQLSGLPMEIDRIERVPAETGFQWMIYGYQCSFDVWSATFKQYLRSAPILKQSQTLSIEERGGVSFSRAIGA